MKIKQAVNTWLLVAAILLICLQLLLIEGIVASKLPAFYTEQATSFFLHDGSNVHKYYSVPVYRIFVVLNLMLMFVGFLVFKGQLTKNELTGELIRFVLATSVWVVLGFLAVFKMMVHGSPDWAKGLLNAAIWGNALTWLTWGTQRWWLPQSGRLCGAFFDWQKKWSRMDLFIVLGIGMVVTAAPQRIEGVFSNYGVYVPIDFLIRNMWLAWGLMTGVYVLLRLSLRFFWLAVAGIILFLKWQMFHWGIALPLTDVPIIWAHPQLLMWPQGQLPDLPYYWCLHWGLWGAFTFSFMMPLIYMTSLLQAMNALQRRYPLRLAWWRAIVSALGLIFFGYYVRYPIACGYLSFSWVLVLLLGMWIDDWLASLKSASLRQASIAVLLMAAVVALLTNQLWFVYLKCKGGLWL